MPRLTLMGHPVHPQLIPIPAALLPTSLLLDLAHHATGKRSYADAAYYTLVMALAGGAAAGAAGTSDYLEIPHDTRPKRLALLHGLMNAGILGATAANVALRRGRGSTLTTTLLSMGVNAVAFVSLWYGGHLVYEHGVRVRGVGGLAETPEVKLPMDDALIEPLLRLEEALVPAPDEMEDSSLRIPTAV